MMDGVSINIDELIAYKRYARQSYYQSYNRLGYISGPKLSKFHGRGMDFTEARNYQSGDEIRHMEWRVTARTGRPHIKVYHEEKEQQMIIVNDFNPSMYFGTKIAFKSVIAAKLAAIIAWIAIKQGDRVGGLLFDAFNYDVFVPKSRDKGILPWLAKLSAYTKQYQQMQINQYMPLSTALLKLRHIVRHDCMIILISDFYQLDAESEMHLNRLHMHNDILLYHVCDVVEIEVPISALYTISDGHETSILDLCNADIAKKYQQFCDHRQHIVHSLCNKLNIQYALVTNTTDIGKIARQTLLRRSGA